MVPSGEVPKSMQGHHIGNMDFRYHSYVLQDGEEVDSPQACNCHAYFPQ